MSERQHKKYKAPKSGSYVSFPALEIGGNYLTLRDMNAMLRAGGMRGFPALVRRLGGQPEALLRKPHIAPNALDHDDALVSVRPLVLLSEDCAQGLNAPDFG